MTDAGIRRNIEQISISKSWADPTQHYITEKLCDQFKRLWENEDDSCIVVAMPQAIRDSLLQTYRSDTPPTETDLRTLYGRATGTINEPPATYDSFELPRPSFAIPLGLQFEDGPFEHQGNAVNAWCDTGYRGVLEMATGSGKTIAAMICAHRLYEEYNPLLIVVAAPYIPLIQQWCDEISPFGLKAVNLTVSNGARGRARELQ